MLSNKMPNLIMFGILFFVGLTSGVLADDREDCVTGAGTFMSGTVVSGPTFKDGAIQTGGGLSARLTHTHFRFIKDNETAGQTYDVAVDNVFASGYDDAPGAVPRPLSDVKVGDHIEMCGQEYPDKTGIHWVHTNCGDTATAETPNGFFKVISESKATGPNLEQNQEYCPLWPRK